MKVKAASQQLPFSQAAMAALYDTTSSCIDVAASAKICSAMVHWTHFSQALIAAATVTAVIGTSAADMQANKKMAACHSPLFSHALMQAPKLAASGW